MPPGIKIAQEDIFVGEGDAPVFVLEFTEPDPDDPTGETEVPYDLTDQAVEVVVKALRDDDDDDALAVYSSPSSGVTIRTPASDGLADLQVTEQATATHGIYFYKIRVVKNGNKLTTKIGKWRVENT